MAMFKVGQRVKKIALANYWDEVPVGVVGVIVPTAAHSIGDEICWRPDGLRRDAVFYAHPWQLAPLTDPQADAFIESLKKLAREPQPLKEHA